MILLRRISQPRVFTPRLRRRRHSLRLFYGVLPIVRTGIAVAAARSLLGGYHSGAAA